MVSYIQWFLANHDFSRYNAISQLYLSKLVGIWSCVHIVSQDSLTSCCFLMIYVGSMIVIYTFNPSRVWAVNSVKQDSPTTPTSCSTKSTTECSSPFYSQCCPVILLLKCYSLIKNCLYTYMTLHNKMWESMLLIGLSV